MTRLHEDPERDHRREIESHLSERVDELVAAGMSEHEAERKARAEFGDPSAALREMGTIARRSARRRRLGGSGSALWTDLRGVVRSLRRSPWHTAAVTLTLALGIAATTTLFTVVDRVLLRPLPYDAPERIVTVWAVSPDGQNTSPSLPDFQDWAVAAPSFEALAFVRGGMLTHLDPELGAARFSTAFVTSGFEAALRPPLAYGSLAAFADPDGTEPVVALKYGTFLRRFGADPSLVGEVLAFSDGDRRLVAVLRDDVDYPMWADAFAPLTPSDATAQGLRVRDYRLDNRALGRLVDGRSLEGVRAELNTVAAGLGEQYPDTNRDWRATAEPLRDLFVGGHEASLWSLFAAVAGLLVIAVANAAGLATARLLSRGRELAVRVSLGVSPGRLTGLILLENALLALAGGALGVVITVVATPRLVASVGGVVGAAGAGGPDGRILLFALGVSLLSGLVAGGVPGLLAARRPIMGRIRGSGGSRAAERARGVFVGVQVALTVALVSTTALFARSLATLQTTEVGVETAGLSVLRVTLPSDYAGAPDRRAELWAGLVEDLRADPRVAGAAVANHAPLSGTGVLSPARVGADTDDPVPVWMRMVGEDFLPLVGLRITQGRGFGADDHTASSGAILVSETVARMFWSDGAPLGRRISLRRQLAGETDFGTPIEATVVGVVEDTRVTIQSDPTPAVYLPMEVHPWSSAYLVVRGAPGTPLQGTGGLQPLLGDVIGSADPTIPVDPVRSYEEVASTSIRRDRFVASLSSTFAGVALLFATVGIHGGLAFIVGRRARGLAIRVALGSSAVGASWSVLRPTLWVVAGGALAGTALTAYLTRFLGSVLVGVDPLDPASFVAALGSIAVVAVIAAWLPVRRAVKTDAVAVLKS